MQKIFFSFIVLTTQIFCMENNLTAPLITPPLIGAPRPHNYLTGDPTGYPPTSPKQQPPSTQPAPLMATTFEEHEIDFEGYSFYTRREIPPVVNGTPITPETRAVTINDTEHNSTIAEYRRQRQQQQCHIKIAIIGVSVCTVTLITYAMVSAYIK